MSIGQERAEALRQAYNHCAALARDRARDFWLGALFAPEGARPHLHALAAFEAEIARVRAAVREPLAGEMRLAWWREALAGARDAEVSSHPVAAALIDTKAKFALPAQAFEDLLQARIFDLYDDPMPTLADLEAYCRQTASALFALAALVLGEGRDLGAAEASEAAGLAVGLTQALRTFPQASARGQVYLPREMLERHGVSVEDVRARRDGAGLRAALGELREIAERRLVEAQTRVAALPAILAPAFVPLGAVRLDLKRLKRAEASPFAPFAEAPAWRRQLALWLWARGRRGA
ncbi:MAG TPA: squalene/phytoene synthase family protein [Roseiarcus sp.]|nr:squalene/phytoene synthase family protein [Roseiarcus sp.]